jgi:pyoverdine/dityrosine biosynthesis protein Dit1
VSSVPLSKADVAAALVVMKRFASYLEVDKIAVESWHALLEPVVPDAGVLREAIMAVFREESDSRDLSARIVAAARDLTGWEPPSPYENITARVVAAQKKAELEKRGITEDEFEKHKHDPAWIRQHFPDAMGHLEQ